MTCVYLVRVGSREAAARVRVVERAAPQLRPRGAQAHLAADHLEQQGQHLRVRVRGRIG